MGFTWCTDCLQTQVMACQWKILNPVMGSLSKKEASYSDLETVGKNILLICTTRQIDHTQAVPKSNGTLSVNISHLICIWKQIRSQCSLQRVGVTVSLCLITVLLAQQAGSYI